MMRIWLAGRAPAQENMARDSRLLKNLESDPRAVLHLYDWEGDSTTYGHFIKPEKLFSLERVKARGLTLQKRPTGGGVIFHLTDLTFSLAIPAGHPLFFSNTLKCYSAVNQIVLESIREFLGKDRGLALLPNQPEKKGLKSDQFCMAHPTKYDVILGGKIGGAAQRRSSFGYLHQGSISIADPPYDYIEEVLIEGQKIAFEMKRHSQSLLGDFASSKALEEAKQTLREILIKRLSLLK